MAFGEHMEKHEKIPVNLKQLQCILCEKILCNNSTLESHVRVHVSAQCFSHSPFIFEQLANTFSAFNRWANGTTSVTAVA